MEDASQQSNGTSEVTFTTSDGKRTTLFIDAKALSELSVEQFLRLAEQRYAAVFGKDNAVTFTGAVSAQHGQLALADKFGPLAVAGQQFTCLQQGEDVASIERGLGRRNADGGKEKGFKIVETPVCDAKGRPTGEVDISIRLVDQNVLGCIQQLLPNEENIYRHAPKIELEKFLPILESLKTMANDPNYSQYLMPLYKYVDEHFAETTSKINALRKAGKISYGTIWSLFPEGSKAYGYVNDLIVGVTVAKHEYFGGFFPGLYVTGKVIKSDGQNLFEVEHGFFVPKFTDVVDIKDLPVQPLEDEALLNTLIKRGRAFQEVAIGNHYRMYSSNILYKTWMSTVRFNAVGRVMVDGASFNQLNPNYQEFKNNQHGRRGGGAAAAGGNTLVPENKLFMTWPTIGGFSFKNKKWGEIIIEHLSPVVFDEEAFKRLVLPSDQKALIQALVEKQGETISDFISQKGGGCIFLLHGPPGVGKTLTAESISEYLKRPLYSIGVGELGTEPSSLEKSLSEVLEVAVRWNSVILLDEADIFLERRTLQDIKRNALVGIFLRLLEYHTGVLFLTTNRVKSFDPAFHSRISIALRYPALSESERLEIWSQLLIFAGLAQRPLNVPYLAKYDLNGRQIRTIIKLASSLALKEGVPVEQRHFDTCIKISERFRQDLKASGLEIDAVEDNLSSSHQHHNL